MATQRKTGAKIVVATWIISRTILFFTLVAASHNSDRSLEQSINNWDVTHFITIATSGYTSEEVAFFPGLPLLLRALSLAGIQMWIGGVLIAAISSAIAAWALYKLFGPAAACLWLISPMAIFTFVGYTEAPFAAAAFWAWQRAQSGRWAQAGWLVALACTLRISCLFLIAGLAIMALTQPKKTLTAKVRDGAWLTLGLFVICCYLIYIHRLTGSWMGWFDAQSSGWGRTIQWPWDGLKTTIEMTSPDYWQGSLRTANMFKLELVAAGLGYLATLIAFFTRRWAAGTYLCANMIALTFSGWFMSISRAILGWFPLFGAIDWIFTKTPNSRFMRGLLAFVIIAVLVVSVVMMVWWAYGFALGQWSS